MANRNVKNTTNPTTLTSSGTASMKQTTTDRRDWNRVMVRSGLSALRALSALSPLLSPSPLSAPPCGAAMSRPEYPASTSAKSNLFQGSLKYSLALLCDILSTSSRVKKPLRPSSNRSNRVFHALPVPSVGRYSASDTQLTKITMTTSSSKSSLSTTGPQIDETRAVKDDIKSSTRRRVDRPPLTPTLRALRRALTTGSALCCAIAPPDGVGSCVGSSELSVVYLESARRRSRKSSSSPSPPMDSPLPRRCLSL